MTDGEIVAHNLRLEVSTRRMAGPLHAGRRWPWLSLLLYIPAAVLVLLLLVVPAGFTVERALRADLRLVEWCAVFALAAIALVLLWRHDITPRLAKVGVPQTDSAEPPGEKPVPQARPRLRALVRAGLFAAWPLAFAFAALAAIEVTIELGPAGRGAYGRTLLWVALMLVMLWVGFWVAWQWRNTWWMSWPVVLPFGVSAFATGVAARLVVGWAETAGLVKGIAGEYVWYMGALFMAFLWTWFGVILVLFRGAVAAVEADPVRRGHIDGPGGRILWYRLVLMVRPVVLVIGLGSVIAAARVFDAVLIAVPGALQYSLDSATVHWWRLATGDPHPGRAAAYAIPLVVIVGLTVWVLQIDAGKLRTSWVRSAPRRDPVRKLLPWWQQLRVWIPTVVVLSPLVLLLVVGFTGTGGPGFYGANSIWHDETLWRALQNTFEVAAWATALTLGAALPVAYQLAALRPERPAARSSVILLVVLAVLPAQLYVGPIRQAAESLGLTGLSRATLILVHAAIGLPMAVLILRGALLPPPDSPEADAPRGSSVPVSDVLEMMWRARPAVGAVAVLELIQVWNDFFVGLLVSGADVSPWSVLLWGEAREFNEKTGYLAAGALISAVPPVLLLLFTWRRFLVPGLSGGVLR
ncbi:hypothetical protein [Nocardia sp. BMG111209]|uniref:hypothetical protein n=1 Tax=Nocardia sp. BMG111209 TaxID=1160137 RepID=UPI000381DF57|nr:hypothetical protein [Nocardia sp. BMG111209]